MPYKTCIICFEHCGPRSKKCSQGHPFDIKVKSKREKDLKPKTEEVDWKTLKRHDWVKVLVGSGPYYEVDEQKIYIGCDGGKYEVLSLERDGFFVKEDNYRKFVYMGETKPGVVGTKEPHKIKLIKRHDT